MLRNLNHDRHVGSSKSHLCRILSTGVATLLQDNVDKITFYPGLSGSDLPFGTLTAVKVRSSPVAQHVPRAWTPTQCCWSVLRVQPEGSGAR